MAEFSCEHCDELETGAPRECGMCSCSMCASCAMAHDEAESSGDLGSFCAGPETTTGGSDD